MAELWKGGGEPPAREGLERNERLHKERLRADAQRPAGDLLEEAMRLSVFAIELRSAPRRPRR